MDGTLLDDAKNFPHDYFEIVKELQPKNILFSVASGRQYYTLLEQLYDIKDSVVFISGNGTYVAYRGEVIYENIMHKSKAMKLVDVGRKIENTFIILCCKNGAYVESNDIDFLNEAKKYYNRLEIVEDITKVDDEIIQVTFCNLESTEARVYPHLKHFENDFKVMVSGKIWLDVVNRDVNKGVAIEKIQQDFNIGFDETLVFGDYLNDIEMMGTAKYSYAMKNAHPEILKVSAFVTEFDNNNFGVTKTIRELLLPEKVTV